MIKFYEDTLYICLPFGYRLIFKDRGIWTDNFKYVGWYKANRK